MFILMAAVFSTGFFQAVVPVAATSSVFLLFSTSLLVSQFISNVPFVALFTPLFQQAGMSVNETMALVAGSTLAGNLTILGAASNVIVIQNAERQGETITFMEFIRFGIPFTLVTGVVFGVWLSLF
jgi:Na+/H+ antiporter NhaD/arsenite permease-like protein